MTPAGPTPRPLRLEQLLGVLPDRGALGPLVAHLVGSSSPDPERRWTTSGELGTAGERLIDLAAYLERAQAWAADERMRLERRARTVAEVGAALEQGDGVRVVDLLLAESGVLEGEGKGAEALQWAEAAARSAREVGSSRLAEAMRRAARCARAVGLLDEAAVAYEAAWARARDEGLFVDGVVAATGRGNVAVDRGRWGEAEFWYTRALEQLDGDARASTSPDEARGLRWRLFQNLGITHRERGELSESAEWYRRAAAEARGLEDLAAAVEIENGRGQLALAQGTPRVAEAHFREALTALGEGDADAVRVAVLVNLAEAILRQGRLLEAGLVAREAEAEAIRGGFVQRLPEVYRTMARIARERGEDEAFVLVARALEIVRDAHLPALEEALTLRVYGELREAQGEHEVAEEARGRAQAILRGLRGDDLVGRDDTMRSGGASS